MNSELYSHPELDSPEVWSHFPVTNTAYETQVHLVEIYPDRSQDKLLNHSQLQDYFSAIFDPKAGMQTAAGNAVGAPPTRVLSASPILLVSSPDLFTLDLSRA